MISSLWKIEFMTSRGTLVLLDFGDFIASEISPKVAQGSDARTPIGAEWGKQFPQGGASVALSWSVRREHESHADLRGFVMRQAATFPSGMTGTLRLSIQDGEVWDIHDSILASAEPIPLVPSGGFQTLTAYVATGGRMVPGAAIDLYPGIPWVFLLQDWDDLTGDWDAL